MYCKFKGIVSLFKTHGDPIYPKFKSAMICSPMRPVSPLTSISATNIPYFPSFISINFLYKKYSHLGVLLVLVQYRVPTSTVVITEQKDRTRLSKLYFFDQSK